ncbi:hypothetical protein G9A89_012484 [Geosiphon pyriformis]|nr:hypothetical protein G9A89_012484 [Geosiphon pyriformis]
MSLLFDLRPQIITSLSISTLCLNLTSQILEQFSFLLSKTPAASTYQSSITNPLHTIEYRPISNKHRSRNHKTVEEDKAPAPTKDIQEAEALAKISS